MKRHATSCNWSMCFPLCELQEQTVGQLALKAISAGCLSAAIAMVTEEDNTLRSVIGIDLGTSSNRVGVYMNGHVEIIPSDEGNRTMPSWVAFTGSETLIGEAAKNQAAVNAQRTVFDVKRLIGREFEDKEVQRIMKLVPYKIVNKGGKPYIQVEIEDEETKAFSPEEISAIIVTKMKKTAEAFLGKKITDAVVPVPTYYNDNQRQATKDACLLAGLNSVRIIDKPMAVAYAYGLHEYGLHEAAPEKNFLIFDVVGDGTFDVSILEIGYGVFMYRASTHLGGEDLNQRILEYLIKNKHEKDVSVDLVKLRIEAEHANRAFSSRVDDLSEPLIFEEVYSSLLMGLVNKAMEDAGLEKHQIDDIILVGGSSNIPKVQLLLRDYFNGKVEPKKSVNPDEAVAIGAAVEGDLLMKPQHSAMC
ncbi:hypothetical protein E3N88_13829 [Mikania micrantha]|uniref:Uncharacterized protein n=1 Tax=Mikania micrantha TaxID=192012 RepID=A0A5N6NZQ2_9ASTR|nr:hypothetical protein E3N88_13829 [Mikania micrantha]